ncbi:hypothetical protein Lesp02_46840 [Lentzea sp. NBRC 105346]|uniref:hypothetical protein n=1 Tax=Lentzea sp. NBRC 105346 TaxID=3032205 RepID=UPI0024A0F247|nr:hypothetical protein [Lentzea sp. NBRC 105346]GLZ32496.1 hypothetical protein Lesp02_46840 [Lentzea sp. NBRC 105346]
MELPRAWQRPDPLRGLDRIPWDELSDGRGSAEGLDALLRALVAPEYDARERALAELTGRLLTDDTVSEASTYAVPFLVELGASYKVAAHVRDRVIFLLAAMALADKGFTEDGKRTRRRWNSVGRELPRTAPDWITQTRHAVATGAPRIFEALAQENAACVVALVCSVADKCPSYVDGLMQEAANECDDNMLREAAEVALHLLRKQETPDLLLLGIAQGHPKVLKDYETTARPANQPHEVTVAKIGYRFALIAAYGDDEGESSFTR